MQTRNPVGKPRLDLVREELDNQWIRVFTHERTTHLCIFYLEEVGQMFTMKTKEKSPHTYNMGEGKEIILRYAIREASLNRVSNLHCETNYVA